MRRRIASHTPTYRAKFPLAGFSEAGRIVNVSPASGSRNPQALPMLSATKEKDKADRRPG